MGSHEAQTFPQFIDEHLATLPPGGVARHYQLFPGIYPSDIAGGIFQEFAEDEAAAAQRYTESFRGVFGRILDNEIALQRLCVLPSADFVDINPNYRQAELSMRVVSQRLGEETRFVRFGRKLTAGLVEACGEDSPLATRYLYGAEIRVPQASFWTARPSPQSGLTAVRVMNYDPDEPTRLDSQTLLPPFDRDSHQDFLTYENFWREIFEDPARSQSLQEITGEQL